MTLQTLLPMLKPKDSRVNHIDIISFSREELFCGDLDNLDTEKIGLNLYLNVENVYFEVGDLVKTEEGIINENGGWVVRLGVINECSEELPTLLEVLKIFDTPRNTSHYVYIERENHPDKYIYEDTICIEMRDIAFYLKEPALYDKVVAVVFYAGEFIEDNGELYTQSDFITFILEER